MPISVHWPSKVITVPQSYLTSLGGDLYELDIDEFRLELKDLEDGEQGISYLDTHNRNAPVTLAGATYAQTLEVINGYTVTFEDGQYAVNLVGANSNLSDVTNVNQVSVRSFNSAGLIVTSGGGSAPTANQVASAVWDKALSAHVTAGSAGKTLADTEQNTDIIVGAP